MPALAQGTAWPVSILVPFPGGGTMDLVARLFAPVIGPMLGAPIVIDNRPDGGTVIATQEAAPAAPDGTTLPMTSNSFTINPFIERSLPYDGERDFAPLVHMAVLPHMLVVHPTLGVRDLAGLVALSRSRPGGCSARTG